MSPAAIKPKSIHAGDTIGILAPASPITRELLQAGCAALEQLGFRPVFSPSIYAEEMYFAGAHQERARELERMFADPEIKAIICARGGYGTNHLLPLLEFEVIRKNPKVFIGYSDISTLLTYFHDSTGLTTFHGPMVTKDFAHPGSVDLASFFGVLGGEHCSFNTEDASVLREGKAEGKLYGGCLSLLAASLGTRYEVQTAGTLLFLEDIGTKPYQIDRLLTQLRFAGKLDEVRGIIFGEMMDCVQHAEQGYTLQQVILRSLAGLNVPIVFGVRSGHVSSGNLTLPLGVNARLSANTNSIRFEILEPATVD